MDMAAIRSFRAGVEAAIDDRDLRTLVLDMSGVQFMDSSMLRELLRLNQELRQQGAWPVLAGLQGPVRRLLDLTRTAELFRLAESREAALAPAPGPDPWDGPRGTSTRPPSAGGGCPPDPAATPHGAAGAR